MAEVQEVLQRVHDNGHTYKGIYEGWYCPRCADFKVENEILEGNRCPIHEIPLDARAGGELVLPPLHLPGAARAAVRRAARLRDAAAPLQRGAVVHHLGAAGRLALPRRGCSWGVTVPWDPEHVFYVWFDALLNYYTALGYARPGEDLTDRYWPADLPRHRQGHPQVPHRVLAGAADGRRAARCPEHVFVHGFLLGADGRKMSKSLGNVLDPFEVMDEFGTDALRFYLMRDVPFGGRWRGRHGRGQVSLRVRAGQRVRQPGQPHDRHGRPLPRRSDPRRGRRPRAGRASSRASPHEVRALLDRAEPTQALELIWQRVRRLTATSRNRRRGSSPRIPPRPASSIRRSPRWPRACASSACCCTPTCRRAPSGCSRRSVLRRSVRGRDVRRARQRRDGHRAGAAVSQAASVIDSHTHLDFCEPPDAELVAAAVAGGREPDGHRRHQRRVVPRGAGGRRGLSRRSTRRSAATRTRRPASTTPTWPSSRRSRPRQVRGDRRDRARLLPRLRAARRPAARVRGPDRARARDRQATGDPHPRCRRGHAATLLEQRPAGCG